MERAAAGQAALRHPPPAAAPTATKAEHGITPRITPGHRFTAAPRATALKGAQGGE